MSGPHGVISWVPGCLLSILLLSFGAGAGKRLVFQGDFEGASEQSPPPGWTMWGAERYKKPANYTRDTVRPHGGQACFRLHHPANTAGYVVSSPEHPIVPKRGMSYTVSFWARADRPGGSVFGLTAYRSIKPYVDAPVPGFFPIEVGPEWREFRFVLHEGWDFFADRALFLLLTFKVTTEEREERTLWIDDVAVTEAPCPREGRLLDPDAIEHEPLPHRLREGERLDVTVDATQRLRRATREAGGISFHRVAGYTGVPYDREGRYALAPELEEAVREMRLPMTRFYAVGDEPFGLEAALDKAAEFCRRIGVPSERVVLEFETQGATSKLPPETWARGVRHALARGYGFRHWEVTNEPYVGRTGRAFPTADAYLEHFRAVSAAIRAAHPEGQIGLPIHPRSTAWGSYLLKQAAGHYDFVVGHYYAFLDLRRATFEDAVLGANYQVLDDVLKVNALVRAYNPGREVYQLDTEWGLHCGGPQGERADDVRRNANIVGTLHRAVRLIYYAREGLLRGASSWEMFTRVRSPGFGILSKDAPGKRFLLYWLYYYFNRHVGEWVVGVDGTAPYYRGMVNGEAASGPLTPVLATLSADGTTLHLVIANGSWTRAVPCRVALRGFRVARTTAVVLSHGDPDAHPLLERKEDAVREFAVRGEDAALACTVPEHAVLFVAVESEK